MTNAYYTATGAPVAQSRGSSATIRAESLLVQQGFDKLPDPSVFGGNAQTYAVDTGLVNALVCTVNSNITSYYDGMELVVKVLATNTGASTIAPGTLGIKTINRSDGTPLQAADMTAGQICQFRYSTTTSSFQLVTTPIGAVNAATATAVSAAATATAAAAAAQAAASPTSRLASGASIFLYQNCGGF